MHNVCCASTTLITRSQLKSRNPNSVQLKDKSAGIMLKKIRSEVLGSVYSIPATVITGIIVAIIVGIGKFSPQDTPPLPNPLDNFHFVVQVTDKISGNALPKASVTLELSGKMPHLTNPDSNGYAQISIPGSYADTSAMLIVKAGEYQTHNQIINVTTKDLPTKVQLMKIVSSRPLPKPALHTTKPLTDAVIVSKPPTKTDTTVQVRSVSVKPSSTGPTFPCSARVAGYRGVRLNRVRFTPSEDTLSKEPVEGGSTVTIIEANADKNAWYYISYNNGKLGWIPAKYITLSEHCSD